MTVAPEVKKKKNRRRKKSHQLSFVKLYTQSVSVPDSACLCLFTPATADKTARRAVIPLPVGPVVTSPMRAFKLTVAGDSAIFHAREKTSTSFTQIAKLSVAPAIAVLVFLHRFMTRVVTVEFI